MQIDGGELPWAAMYFYCRWEFNTIQYLDNLSIDVLAVLSWLPHTTARTIHRKIFVPCSRRWFSLARYIHCATYLVPILVRRDNVPATAHNEDGREKSIVISTWHEVRNVGVLLRLTRPNMSCIDQEQHGSWRRSSPEILHVRWPLTLETWMFWTLVP
jgi:hypothetical protein